MKVHVITEKLNMRPGSLTLCTMTVFVGYIFHAGGASSVGTTPGAINSSTTPNYLASAYYYWWATNGTPPFSTGFPNYTAALSYSTNATPAGETFTLSGNNVNPSDLATDSIGGDIATMRQLYNYLLFGYDTRIRPRLNQSHAVSVDTKFTPFRVLDFDAAKQKFSVLGYFEIAWTDEVLRWNSSDYYGTNTVKLPINEIWTPNILIVKPYSGGGIVGNQDTDTAKISSEGHVQWVPDGTYSVICDVDIKYFPFDKQSCTIEYYVSDETQTTVILDHPGDIDTSECSENSAWKVTEIAKRRSLRYNGYFITIEFKLQRRANFTTFTLIMPLLLLAFLNACIFLVPIGSGEKGSLAITVFLSYGIFVTIASETLPDNSLQVSYFLLLIIALLLLSVITVFYTVLQAKLFASIGHKECSLRFLRLKKNWGNKVGALPDKNGETKSQGESEYSDHAHVCFDSEDAGKQTNNGTIEASDDESYTWATFLNKLDTVAFVIFLVLILVTTVWSFTLMHGGE